MLKIQYMILKQESRMACGTADEALKVTKRFVGIMAHFGENKNEIKNIASRLQQV